MRHRGAPIPAYIMSIDDPGDLNAEKGSVAWARAIRYQLRKLGDNSKTTLSQFQTYLRLLDETHGYQQLDTEDGHPFPSLTAFASARVPFGLGYDPEVILQIQQETRDMLLGEKVRELRDGPGPPEGNQNARKNNGSNYYHCYEELEAIGRGANYYKARLKRDYPDIFAAYERKEYRSIHAAAKAAGLVRDPTPLERLGWAWNKATDEEKQRFAHEVVTDEQDRQALLKELLATNPFPELEEFQP